MAQNEDDLHILNSLFDQNEFPIDLLEKVLLPQPIPFLEQLKKKCDKLEATNETLEKKIIDLELQLINEKTKNNCLRINFSTIHKYYLLEIEKRDLEISSLREKSHSPTRKKICISNDDVEYFTTLTKDDNFLSTNNNINNYSDEIHLNNNCTNSTLVDNLNAISEITYCKNNSNQASLSTNNENVFNTDLDSSNSTMNLSLIISEASDFNTFYLNNNSEKLSISNQSLNAVSVGNSCPEKIKTIISLENLKKIETSENALNLYRPNNVIDSHLIMDVALIATTKSFEINSKSSDLKTSFVNEPSLTLNTCLSTDTPHISSNIVKNIHHTTNEAKLLNSDFKLTKIVSEDNILDKPKIGSEMQLVKNCPILINNTKLNTNENKSLLNFPSLDCSNNLSVSLSNLNMEKDQSNKNLFIASTTNKKKICISDYKNMRRIRVSKKVIEESQHTLKSNSLDIDISSSKENNISPQVSSKSAIVVDNQSLSPMSNTTMNSDPRLKSQKYKKTNCLNQKNKEIKLINEINLDIKKDQINKENIVLLNTSGVNNIAKLNSDVKVTTSPNYLINNTFNKEFKKPCSNIIQSKETTDSLNNADRLLLYKKLSDRKEDVRNINFTQDALKRKRLTKLSESQKVQDDILNTINSDNNNLDNDIIKNNEKIIDLKDIANIKAKESPPAMSVYSKRMLASIEKNKAIANEKKSKMNTEKKDILDTSYENKNTPLSDPTTLIRNAKTSSLKKLKTQASKEDIYASLFEENSYNQTKSFPKIVTRSLIKKNKQEIVKNDSNNHCLNTFSECASFDKDGENTISKMASKSSKEIIKKADNIKFTLVKKAKTCVELNGKNEAESSKMESLKSKIAEESSINNINPVNLDKSNKNVDTIKEKIVVIKSPINKGIKQTEPLKEAVLIKKPLFKLENAPIIVPSSKQLNALNKSCETIVSTKNQLNNNISNDKPVIKKIIVDDKYPSSTLDATDVTNDTQVLSLNVNQFVTQSDQITTQNKLDSNPKVDIIIESLNSPIKLLITNTPASPKNIQIMSSPNPITSTPLSNMSISPAQKSCPLFTASQSSSLQPIPFKKGLRNIVIATKRIPSENVTRLPQDNQQEKLHGNNDEDASSLDSEDSYCSTCDGNVSPSSYEEGDKVQSTNNAVPFNGNADREVAIETKEVSAELEHLGDLEDEEDANFSEDDEESITDEVSQDMSDDISYVEGSEISSDIEELFDMAILTSQDDGDNCNDAPPKDLSEKHDGMLMFGGSEDEAFDYEDILPMKSDFKEEDNCATAKEDAKREDMQHPQLNIAAKTNIDDKALEKRNSINAASKGKLPVEKALILTTAPPEETDFILCANVEEGELGDSDWEDKDKIKRTELKKRAVAGTQRSGRSKEDDSVKSDLRTKLTRKRSFSTGSRYDYKRDYDRNSRDERAFPSRDYRQRTRHPYQPRYRPSYRASSKSRSRENRSRNRSRSKERKMSNGRCKDERQRANYSK